MRIRILSNYTRLLYSYSYIMGTTRLAQNRILMNVFMYECIDFTTICVCVFLFVSMITLSK